ncbi:MAG TPA: ribonuclease H [Bacteroidetes bacterium]|nr:ribonuclease H [Bacteroidota bacterium]
MAKKNKYYVVWKGRKPGVYNSWDECKKQIFQYEGAEYKGFPTKLSAEKAYKGQYIDYKNIDARKLAYTEDQLKLIGKPKKNSIAVDAACSGNPGVLEYRGVYTKTGQEIFRMGPFPEGTVNIGEFLALVHGLAELKRKGLNDFPIYSDSRTAIAWVKKKKANTKLKENDKNRELFELIRRAEKWLNENEITNPILKWQTEYWGEIPADFGRK